MNTIIDIVSVAIILICAIIGFVRGFAQTFVKAFGTIIALILAVLLSGVVAGFLESQFSLTTTISGAIEGALTNVFGNELMNTTLEEAANSTLTESGVSGLIIKLVLSLQGASEIPMDTTLNQIICPVFSYYVTVIIAVIVLFILFKLALKLLAAIIFSAHSISLVKGIDQVLGFILGMVEGFFTVSIIIVILGFIPVGFCQNITAAIPNTIVTNFIANVNVISLIMEIISNPSQIISIIEGALPTA